MRRLIQNTLLECQPDMDIVPDIFRTTAGMEAGDAVGVVVTVRATVAAHQPLMYNAAVGECGDDGEVLIYHTPIVPPCRTLQVTVAATNGVPSHVEDERCMATQRRVTLVSQ